MHAPGHPSGVEHLLTAPVIGGMSLLETGILVVGGAWVINNITGFVKRQIRETFSWT
ncbi:MAG: hypothetical protein Greene041619_594 [Candidatus Peregrinibacteria bacterium Greene0416_19]|nr:MAG: hypothetical protein Greene041619_594 [Candidatus Peregrinibacteria bacterium Greene0416_19]